MVNAVKAIEVKIFDIFDKITSFRLNIQVQKFLCKFRHFQETQIDGVVADNCHLDDSCSEDVQNVDLDLEADFEELFKIEGYDINLDLTDKWQVLQNKAREHVPEQNKKSRSMLRRQATVVP